MAEEEKRVTPRTAAEWIEVCMSAVDRMEESKSLELPEPATPREDATVEEKAAAMDEWTQYRFSQLLRSISGKGRLTGASKAITFMQCMPPLTSRATTKAFIACLAAGLQRKLVTPEDARMLMYTAQLALQAYAPRAKRRPSPSPCPGRASDRRAE